MKVKALTALLAVLLVIAPAVFSQSRETGAITGKAADDQGNPLPGVTLTLSGSTLMGTRSQISDANGDFRFPALPPGVYSVKAELQGFASQVQENVRLTTTTTLALNFAMKPAAVAEELTVVAKAPTVDVKSTETASVTLSNEILRNIPYNQFTSDIVNLAPGVNDDVAYGASASTGVAYTMDGVNVADPDGGSAWVFLDHNIIEEAKIMGIGVPAEYGNFTGVIFNLVTKSGGNTFAGHVEFNFQGAKKNGKFWMANNTGDYIADFPELTAPSNALFDINAHIGGPIKRDKLWFYTGAQYYQTNNRPTGFPEDSVYKQPRWFGKLTAQATPTLNFSASLEVDTYLGNNRFPYSGTITLPEATVNQKSPEIVGNFSLTKILSPKTFFDFKGAYFWGYYYLDPREGMDTYSHYDVGENLYKYNATYYFYADRTRFQVNASLTHYVEDFIQGSHDFKFGAEVERSTVRNRLGYAGHGGPLGDHINYQDYYGEPYLAYQYEGYDTNTRYTRLEAFAQDSWQISKRLNISFGARLSQNWGQVKGVDGNQYTSTRIAPRIGFTFDVLGDKSTILKAHYGQYTEAMLASYLDRLNPASAYKDYISYQWNGEAWEEFDRTVHEELYSMDPDIKHPYMGQFTVGLERELFKDTSFGITYINRRWYNIIGRIDLHANYSPLNVTIADLNKTMQIYERTEDTVGDYKYVLTNIAKDKSPWILLDPYRKYWGLEILFNKRFSNRWQLLASYVYSKASGTTDNGMADDVGYGASAGGLNTDDPNYWINAEGNSTSDPTHMIKLQGSYLIPWIDVSVNAYFRGITGNAWTTRYRTGVLNQGRVTFFAESRGAHHYDMEKVLDMRLEKIFTFAGKYRLGVLFDVFNLFNANTITAWGTRIGYDWNPGTFPSSDGHESLSILRPRQARVGIRLIF